MDWIERLDEDGWNFVIDELAWHLREGRSPVSVHRARAPATGVEFRFEVEPPVFLPIPNALLEEHWDTALKIASSFPELKNVLFQAEA